MGGGAHSLEDVNKEKFQGIHAVKASRLKDEKSVCSTATLHDRRQGSNTYNIKKKKRKSTLQEDITVGQDILKNRGTSAKFKIFMHQRTLLME